MPDVRSLTATLERRADAELGEGPVWDEAHQLLYWVDIMGGRLYAYGPHTRTDTVYDVGGHIGSVALRARGGLVLATAQGFAMYDIASRQLTPLANPEAHLPGNRFNDGKCDPSGRFWAGTMAYDARRGAGTLYCLHPDLRVEAKLRPVSISNGMAWSSAGDVMYYIDTPEAAIFRFDYDAESGRIANRTVVARFDVHAGYPDGMTIDEEGGLWVALYGGGRVVRVDPSAGRTTHEVNLPVPKPTSCTFGGRDLNELYITTCRDRMPASELESAPLSGSLFRADVPFRGVVADRFAG